VNGENPYDALYRQLDMKNQPFGYSVEYVLWRHRQLKGEIAGYIERPGKILDVGGGMGVMWNFLPGFTQRQDYFNLDCSYEMLKYSPFSNVLAVAEQIPFNEAQFDYVVCSEVLEHVFDKDKVLEECYRVLKPEGLLLLTTPRTNWLRDYKGSIFCIFWVLCRIERKTGIMQGLKRLFSDKRSVDPQVEVPAGVLDIPSDEKWLRQRLEDIGFTVLRQYRSDNHFPFSVGSRQGESRFWRWFSDRFVDPKRFGHCTVVIAVKRAHS
jgi:ubiquinone/menaquinone biosynthesis C-methylase UbiE